MLCILAIKMSAIAKKWFQVKEYLLFQWKAGNRHSVHSPFVFELCQRVFEDKRSFHAFKEIDQLRKQRSLETGKVKIIELGAGSKHNEDRERGVGDLVKNVAIPAKYGEVLFKLVDVLQPSTILEMGTSIGFSGLYLHKARQKAPMITLEGNPFVAHIAHQHFEQLNAEAIQIKVGDFKDTLSESLESLQTVGLAFIDGNHTYEATKDYFEKIFPFVNENSCLIFHDIHWSKGMRKAWDEISKDNRVVFSIDLFEMGLVFFNKGVPKQHFLLKVK